MISTQGLLYLMTFSGLVMVAFGAGLSALYIGQPWAKVWKPFFAYLIVAAIGNALVFFAINEALK